MLFLIFIVKPLIWPIQITKWLFWSNFFSWWQVNVRTCIDLPLRFRKKKQPSLGNAQVTFSYYEHQDDTMLCFCFEILSIIQRKEL